MILLNDDDVICDGNGNIPERIVILLCIFDKYDTLLSLVLLRLLLLLLLIHDDTVAFISSSILLTKSCKKNFEITKEQLMLYNLKHLRNFLSHNLSITFTR